MVIILWDLNPQDLRPSEPSEQEAQIQLTAKASVEPYDYALPKKQDLNSLMKSFKCNLNKPSVSKDYKNSFEYISMQNDIDKVNLWVKKYRNGVSEFDMPIEDVVSQQLRLYESSCEALGGELTK